MGHHYIGRRKTSETKQIHLAYLEDYDDDGGGGGKLYVLRPMLRVYENQQFCNINSGEGCVDHMLPLSFVEVRRQQVSSVANVLYLTVR